MAGKFNVTQYLSGMSLCSTERDTAEEQPSRPTLKVVPIKITDLVPTDESINFYSVENKIEELKSAIEMLGVMQPLVVTPIEGGKYRIIAGHRRHRACMKLVAEGKTDFEYIPCGIQTGLDEIKEHILLIVTNSTFRELSDWEKMKQAEELNKYFSILKKQDNLPGRVRDLVAEALNTSSTQIARMDAISKNLAPEFKAEFKAGRLNSSTAYELSGMSADKQGEAYTEYQEKGSLSINDVKAKKEPLTPLPTIGREQAEEQPAPKQPQSASVRIESTPPLPIPTPSSGTTELPPQAKTDVAPEIDDDAEQSSQPENKDFADMSAAERSKAAIALLRLFRFTIFQPGTDTRLYEHIIDVLEEHARTDDD